MSQCGLIDIDAMKSLDICIPAYNEADVIEETVREVAQVLSMAGVPMWRITVADNGSNDGTAAVVEAVAHPNVHVLHVSGRGKGRAIRECAGRSQADVFGFIDADLSAAPEHIPEFLAELDKGAHLVIGSRLKDVRTVDRSAVRTFSSRMFNWYAERMLGLGVQDTQCGLKLMNSEVRALCAASTEETWFLDLELLLLARLHGHVVSELPVQWQECRYSGRKSKLSMVQDGLQAACVISDLRRKHIRRKL